MNQDFASKPLAENAVLVEPLMKKVRRCHLYGECVMPAARDQFASGSSAGDYCQRANIENRIKELHYGLAMARGPTNG